MFLRRMDIGSEDRIPGAAFGNLMLNLCLRIIWNVHYDLFILLQNCTIVIKLYRKTWIYIL